MYKKEQLNRVEFINAMNRRSGVAKYRLEEFMDIFTETIMSEVADNKRVNIQGFGVFEMVERASKEVTIPNGEKCIVESHRSPKFTPGDKFKRLVKEFKE